MMQRGGTNKRQGNAEAALKRQVAGIIKGGSFFNQAVLGNVIRNALEDVSRRKGLVGKGKIGSCERTRCSWRS